MCMAVFEVERPMSRRNKLELFNSNYLAGIIRQKDEDK